MGCAALHGNTVLESSAISPEAKFIRNAQTAISELAEKSQALFGKKADALTQLSTLVYECSEQNWDGNDASAIDLLAVQIASQFLCALPADIQMPEFAPEPDGSVSLDWIKSRNRIFSISIGNSNRLACAWLDGTDRGHEVIRFDGCKIAPKVLNGIRDIVGYGDAAFRIA